MLMWPCAICNSRTPCEHRELELLVWMRRRDSEEQARKVEYVERIGVKSEVMPAKVRRTA